MSARYDAVVFDLLTALIDSWTLWNPAAGSEAKGAGMPVYWHNRMGLAAVGDVAPDFTERSLKPLMELV